jgi:hypothetical protein
LGSACASAAKVHRWYPDHQARDRLAGVVAGIDTLGQAFDGILNSIKASRDGALELGEVARGGVELLGIALECAAAGNLDAAERSDRARPSSPRPPGRRRAPS